MRRLILFVGLAGMVTLIAAREPATSTRRLVDLPCLTPGSTETATIQTIKELLVASRTAAVNWRNAFGVAGVDSSTVAVVADTVACTRVTHVVDSLAQRSPSTQAFLLVLRVGPRYVGFGPDGNGAMYFLDTNFVFKDLSVQGH